MYTFSMMFFAGQVVHDLARLENVYRNRERGGGICWLDVGMLGYGEGGKERSGAGAGSYTNLGPPGGCQRRDETTPIANYCGR